MKLTIDTKEDSVEEIRKAIDMLSQLVSTQNALQEEPSEVPTEQPAGIFNLFNDDTPNSTDEPTPEPEADPPPDPVEVKDDKPEPRVYF